MSVFSISNDFCKIQDVYFIRPKMSINCHLILFFLILYTYICVFVLTEYREGGNILMRKEISALMVRILQ